MDRCCSKSYYESMYTISTIEDSPLILQRADPYVYFHSDGYYYFTASVPEYDRIELRRSWTIEGLANSQPHTIWRKHASGELETIETDLCIFRLNATTGV